jgi:hypothetical protein
VQQKMNELNERGIASAPTTDARSMRGNDRERGHSWLEITATWVAILGALAGGAFGLIRFVGNLEASRAKEALAYIDRFSDAPIATSYVRFADYFRHFLDAGVNHAQPTYDAMVAAIRDQPIEADAIVVTHYFDNVGACTCKNLCDETLVRLFLAWEARDFFDLTKSYILEQRKTGSYPRTLGAGLEALASTATGSSVQMDCSFVTKRME